MSVKVFGNLVPRTFRNERKFQIFVQESCFDFIPRGMKKPVYKQYLKEILMDKYGPSAFLFPDEMMFPVKNIHTGLYDCRLIQYAVVRALTLRRISHDFDYILEAAMKCFLEHGCKESVKITLTDTGEEISLISFLKMLDENGGRMEFEVPDDATAPPKPSCHKPKHFTNPWCFIKYDNCENIFNDNSHLVCKAS